MHVISPPLHCPNGCRPNESHIVLVLSFSFDQSVNESLMCLVFSVKHLFSLCYMPDDTKPFVHVHSFHFSNSVISNLFTSYLLPFNTIFNPKFLYTVHLYSLFSYSLFPLFTFSHCASIIIPFSLSFLYLPIFSDHFSSLLFSISLIFTLPYSLSLYSCPHSHFHFLSLLFPLYCSPIYFITSLIIWHLTFLLFSIFFSFSQSYSLSPFIIPFPHVCPSFYIPSLPPPESCKGR